MAPKSPKIIPEALREKEELDYPTLGMKLPHNAPLNSVSIANIPCDDTECFCHRRPSRPYPKLEALVAGPEPEQFCVLHQPTAQLDVAFDILGNSMTLIECIKDPERPKIAYHVALIMKAANMHFLNLEGLADHSLLLTVKIRRAACAVRGNKMILREKCEGFFTNPPYSRLFNNLFECNWPEMIVQVRMPEERCRRWKTVALILRAFKQISADCYCHMVDDLVTAPRVGGLDVRQIKKQIKSRLARGEPRRENPVSRQFTVTAADEEKIERINHAYEVYLLAFINSSSPFTPRQYIGCPEPL
ncbi:hypothetical protein BO70DRAFT_426018 [Aspergillus heteromorphus CBS 117.55]|uniref:Uncharacterized protein n=1 Tax=Aspergillus heteromorphus CBS 117.55 TaxID=1448321 RepID=A0A317X0M2_9EURO|nr:uncharacterized protein BO70DRAFT_426018 [Aspergillus heteromorphus CBS 117.55]PWY91122.1 hypothetical protein BO70DRAFT_426018 [Aspergillus heteromorphus CBS 117.55]